MKKKTNRNKHVFITLICCGLFFFSCNEKRPDYVLAPEQMEMVMTDLYLIDGAAHAKNINLGDSTKYALYTSVLRQHNTNLAQFDSSLTWYSFRLDEFEKINQHVVDNITAMQEKEFGKEKK